MVKEVQVKVDRMNMYKVFKESNGKRRLNQGGAVEVRLEERICREINNTKDFFKMSYESLQLQKLAPNNIYWSYRKYMMYMYVCMCIRVRL